jgi:KipI family sensor histidine kinase inhibitor
MKQNHLEVKRYSIGDACVCWSFGEQLDRDISVRVLGLYKILQELMNSSAKGILDIVPTYNSLAVYFNPAETTRQKLVDRLDEMIKRELDSNSRPLKGRELTTAVHEIPVVYNGMDLKRVAELKGLEIEQVIALHKKNHYTVAMIGFLPHYPYLIGLDPRLTTPRLESPRNRVAAGSIAIGGIQAGIYPCESPGGWNILGITNPELLKPVNPGDTIIFRQVEHL